MDPGYQNVMDLGNMLPIGLAMMIHLAMLLAQLGLAGFLVGTGVHGLLFLDHQIGGPGGRSVARQLGEPAAKSHNVIRIALGVLLGLPVLAGAPFPVSLLASLLALGLLVALERGTPDATTHYPGQRTRRTAIALAALTAAFIGWEREDALAQGVGLLVNAQHWRSHELAWQVDSDRNAPKVGDLAPDFELRDPSGSTVVRLSDFRGKRPVALIFGSYT